MSTNELLRYTLKTVPLPLNSDDKLSINRILAKQHKENLNAR